MSISKPLYSPANDWLSAYVSNPLQSMGDQTARGLVVLDNNQLKATNIRLMLKVRTTTVVPGGAIRIYMAGSLDGIQFSDNYDGDSGGDFEGGTIDPPTNTPLVATIQTPFANSVVVWEGELLDSMPSLPRYMGLIITNDSGGPLDASFEHALKASYISYEFI